MFKKLGLILTMSISVFAMHSAEININEKDLEFGLSLDMGQYNRNVEPDTTFAGVKYLNASDENSENENGNVADIKYFLEFSFLIKQEIRNSGLKFGLGVKANTSKVADEIFMSIPIGIDVSYELPLKNFIPVEIGGEIYYAPQSLSFLDAESFVETRLGLRLEVIERASIFVGYRNLNTNYKLVRVTYNRAAYFGFNFEF